MYDAIIVGAGPAGLNAALILGRCRRRVLLCDNGQPRNGASRALHGFLSRDGVPPLEFRKLGWEQLAAYSSVTARKGEAVDAVCLSPGFEVTLDDGSRHEARTLLLATGVIDRLPEIPGVRELYGKSVFHCPYCDGWEQRDRALAAFGPGSTGAEYALELRGWSQDVVLCTGGEGELSEDLRERLVRHAIGLREERIERLEAEEGRLRRIVFTGGSDLPRDAFFFYPEQVQRSPLPERLGCRITPGGVGETGKFQSTEVPGLFLAGDAARSVQLAVVAASEGAQAAFAINTALLEEDFG